MQWPPSPDPNHTYDDRLIVAPKHDDMPIMAPHPTQGEHIGPVQTLPDVQLAQVFPTT